MRTKFAAIIGMIAVMAFSALPAQAAAGADAQQHAVTRRESAFAETAGSYTRRTAGTASRSVSVRITERSHRSAGSLNENT